ncbi:hypothetical protein HRbin07_00006 [bacterium HR07]|uniref:Beta-lactamase class A catalytic domain-containing protein n=2 Tax=Candidatus Bipolaricaulota TaxID=67810 RepID=H5SDJ3_9BACT|nr:hypothetical protein HGMM_F13G06C12 [uncultured Acetothermia bacterium]BAL60259.1 hypothetical protein HGMM_OP4C895 [Candidatus Acetothermum autotrophicum]GBC75818.1 hypothetical protein HRbin07_00006 [bacterium HR07]
MRTRLLFAVVFPCLAVIAAVPQAQEACSGEITERVLQVMKTNGPYSETLGLYLKEVGGPVLAACNERKVFEPASTIKVLHHLHAMLQVQQKVVSLEDSITVYSAYAGSCPLDRGPFTEPLRTTLEGVMRQSDNARTQALRVRFGEANINATAQALGMKDTLLQHRLGCSGRGDQRVPGDYGALDKPNRLTLVDAGLLYESVAQGKVLDSEHRQIFYEIMLGKVGSLTPWGFLRQIITQEIPVGMTQEKVTAFMESIEIRYKAGSYTFCTGFLCTNHQSVAGWARVPFCEGAEIRPREYVLGDFFSEAVGNASIMTSITYAKLLREQVRAALRSCA